MKFLDLQQILTLALLALGVAAVITGSKAGYPIRFLWCRLTPRPLWGLVRCPYCNAWWGGLVGAVTLLPSVEHWFAWLQAAFTSCGVVRVIQAVLGGDGIAMVEDFETVFKHRGEK